MTGSGEILRDAAAVWHWLVTEGGLDPEYYDAALEADLRVLLGLPGDGDLAALLTAHETATEDCVAAFFNAVRPYGQMMEDLLQMFERAGAKAANQNLAIEFDFGKKIDGLKFDLESFREWVEQWSEVEGFFLRQLWTPEPLWGLHAALGGSVGEPEDIADPKAQQWLRAYRANRTWPERGVPRPRTSYRDLDELIRRAWNVWQTVVRECAKYGPSITTLPDLQWGDRRGERPEPLNDCWPIGVLASLASDHWAFSIVHGAYRLTQESSSADVSEHEKARRANDVAAALQHVFDALPAERIWGKESVRQLESFLSLPVWRRRHELYSAWIATQILDAVRDKRTRIHQVNGAIRFAFSGTHLATVDGYTPGLHLWAELRSPLEKPLGKSRRRAIQPDYSLMSEPITSPESSVLEVECKQYRKQSTENFAAALFDYARGRANADVALVNYGHITPAVLQRVPEEIQPRTFALGEMRPGRADVQDEFKRVVRAAIEKRYSSCAGESRAEDVELVENGRIQLAWGEQPRDLDLHLRLVADGEESRISFNAHGNTADFPWAELSTDVRSGLGPEEIEIVRWTAGTYTVAVHNYSDEASLAGCGAELIVATGTSTKLFRCPEVGGGRWWLVFHLDGRTGELEVVNDLVTDPW